MHADDRWTGVAQRIIQSLLDCQEEIVPGPGPAQCRAGTRRDLQSVSDAGWEPGIARGNRPGNRSGWRGSRSWDPWPRSPPRWHGPGGGHRRSSEPNNGLGAVRRPSLCRAVSPLMAIEVRRAPSSSCRSRAMRRRSFSRACAASRRSTRRWSLRRSLRATPADDASKQECGAQHLDPAQFPNARHHP